MSAKVTIQDIADALGISRNTVSKAINNAPGLSTKTRKKILNQAAEMGYKQFSYLNLFNQNDFPTESDNAAAPDPPSDNKEHREIAVFMEGFQDSSHFAHTMLDKFQRELSQVGYAMTFHHLTAEEVNELRLPLTFSPERVSGIVVLELFSERYGRMLCDLNVPLLFVDAPVPLELEALPADVLLMDNQNGIYSFVHHMVKKGFKKIGFVGRPTHCRSFAERFWAFRNAMYFNHLPIDEDYCLTDFSREKRYPNYSEYCHYLKERILHMKELPDVLICANDFVALDVLMVCRELGYEVPKDLMLCGFDDAPEASIVTPPLTSIHIHTQIMGLSAVQLLLSRINEPDLNYRTVHTETTLIYRESAPF